MSNSGINEIRRALYARHLKINLAGLARDIGITSSALEAFIKSQGALGPDVLNTLAGYLFANAAYDPAIDKLKPAKRPEPVSMGVKPEAMEPWQLPQYTAGPAQKAPGMVAPPQPKAKRAGWVE